MLARDDGSGDHFMLALLKNLHPFAAFLLLSCGIFSSWSLAELFRPMTSEGVIVGIARAIMAFFYSGWSLLIGVTMQNRAMRNRERGRLSAFIGFLYIMTISLVVYPIGEFVLKSQLEMRFLIEVMEFSLVVMIIAGFYVQRFGAKMLVAAEEGRSARFFDYWGTWFLFLFLPIGVLFLQKRVRRVLLSANEG